MWEWCDNLKLNTSSSAFVKRDIRSLPVTDAEFEADFFLDPKYSTKRQERWAGMAAEGKAIELDINDSSGVVSALCGALGIDAPSL